MCYRSKAKTVKWNGRMGCQNIQDCDCWRPDLCLSRKRDERELDPAQEVVPCQTVLVKDLTRQSVLLLEGWRALDSSDLNPMVEGNMKLWITSMTSLCSEGFNLKRNSSSQRGFNVLFLVLVRTESTTWCLQVLRSRRSSTWERYLIAPDCDQINSYIGVAGPKYVLLGQVVRRDHLISVQTLVKKIGAP